MQKVKTLSSRAVLRQPVNTMVFFRWHSTWSACRVTVLVAIGTAGVARAAKTATTKIPIAFANGSDPVRVGLVASMNRPGGNATGVSFYTSSLGPKRLELLRELVPQAATIAFLVNPTNPVTEGDTKDMEDAARSVGQRMIVVRAKNESEIDMAFATVAKEGAGSLLVNVDGFFSTRRDQLASLAARYGIPTSYNNRVYVEAGGLMSYGDNRLDSYRQLGVSVGRILKGDKPPELPVIQPTKFELVINLKTANALGFDSTALAARPRRRGNRMIPARVHHAARGRGGGVAAGGARAAGRADAADRGINGRRRCGGAVAGVDFAPRTAGTRLDRRQ